MFCLFCHFYSCQVYSLPRAIVSPGLIERPTEKPPTSRQYVVSRLQEGPSIEHPCLLFLCPMTKNLDDKNLQSSLNTHMYMQNGLYSYFLSYILKFLVVFIFIWLILLRNNIIYTNESLFQRFNFFSSLFVQTYPSSHLLMVTLGLIKVSPVHVYSR